MKNRFYMTSPHSWTGKNVMFHAIGGNGYTSNIDEAQEFSHEEAQKKVSNGHCRNCNEQEMPLSADHVDAVSTWRIDCQYVNKTYPEFKDVNDEYVAYKKNCWDGNDLKFSSGLDSSFDYSLAMVLTSEDVDPYIENKNENLVFVPKSHTDEIARRTLSRNNIDRRVMVQGAGIKGIRKPRVRHNSGKNRFNCYCCGKIIWEYAHPDCSMTCGEYSCEMALERSRGY